MPEAIGISSLPNQRYVGNRCKRNRDNGRRIYEEMVELACLNKLSVSGKVKQEFTNIKYRYRRVMQDGASFTVMVAGESGLGKTTFINTLFQTKLKGRQEGGHKRLNAGQRTTEIDIVRAMIEEKNFKLRLNVVDTPGYGSNVNNQDSWDPIVDFIDDQHESYMKQEQQPKRERKSDLRVHACLLFVRPTGHSLKPLDIEMMKRLSSRVNLIPVIAKADTLSPLELDTFKQRIRDIIEAQDINIYTPPLDLEDPAATEHAKLLIESMPFAIIGSEDEYEKTPGTFVKGRQYPWGLVEVENENHCDFKKLRSLLLRTNMLDLILSTNEFHFETFRSLRLNSGENGEGGEEGVENGDAARLRAYKKHRKFHSPQFKEEEDALKKFFTEQVKAEDRRFRQWEINIVNERNRLNQDLEDMQTNLNSLREQVKKLQV